MDPNKSAYCTVISQQQIYFPTLVIPTVTSEAFTQGFFFPVFFETAALIEMSVFVVPACKYSKVSVSQRSHLSWFSQDSLCFVGCKELWPGIPQNLIWDTKCPGFSKVIKTDVSDNACKHFHFPTVRKNIRKNTVPLNWSVTERCS